MSIVASPESMQPSPEISALLKENTDLRARVAELEAYRRQHGSAAQAVAWFTEDHLTDKSATTWNPDVVDVWRVKGRPVGELFTAPPVADAERVKTWQQRCNWMSDEPATKLMVEAMKAEIAELRALSRRPAAAQAAAEELAPQDVSVLRRWAEQIERMASVFNDERSLLCQQAAILLHRIAYRPAEVAAEQPAAAGSALTDSAIIGVGATTGVFAPIPNVIAFGRSIEQHLRAAPQAAQGKGLTIDTPQFRVLVSSVAWESRMAPSDAFEAALNRLITHIDQTISAHTRASDGEDAERLDWMIHRGARISHSMDGEACNVWLPAERDGTEERPAEGYPQKRYNDGREAIDAAMQQAAVNKKE